MLFKWKTDTTISLCREKNPSRWSTSCLNHTLHTFTVWRYYWATICSWSDSCIRLLLWQNELSSLICSGESACTVVGLWSWANTQLTFDYRCSDFKFFRLTVKWAKLTFFRWWAQWSRSSMKRKEIRLSRRAFVICQYPTNFDMNFNLFDFKAGLNLQRPLFSNSILLDVLFSALSLLLNCLF